MVEQAAERFGRYELVEKLGQGGMAEVYKAKIRGPKLLDGSGFERTVVIKRILPQFAREEELVVMFMREAQLCSMLSHANIVQVHELGELDGEYYIAMEYVHGRDVQAIVNAKPKEPLPAGAVCVIARDVCRALAYAYGVADERGKPLRVIHRDVTPSNVMLTVDGTVKLVDFGVAKALSMGSVTQTRIGGIRGKLGYSAPEQLQGGKVDHRTDLFAVGVLVHELLTGRRLFQGEDDQETIEHVLEGPIYPPSRINPLVPPALDAIVLRALERDPALRFQSGDEMADAFEPFVHQLAWGPAKVTQLLCARFPELDPALLAHVNEFADDDANTTVTPPQLPPMDSSQHVTIRPTASFVRAVDDMGSWTAHTPSPNDPVIDGGSVENATVTVRGRQVVAADLAPTPARQTPPKREERGTLAARPLRPVTPAAAPAPRSHTGNMALPKPPRQTTQLGALMLIGGAIAIAACAITYVIATPSLATMPAPEPIHAAAPPRRQAASVPPPAPPAEQPVAAPPAEQAVAVPPPVESVAVPPPVEPQPKLAPSHHSRPARASAPPPDDAPRPATLDTPPVTDFDQAPIFTGKPEGSTGAPVPKAPFGKHHHSETRDGDLVNPFGSP